MGYRFFARLPWPRASSLTGRSFRDGDVLEERAYLSQAARRPIRKLATVTLLHDLKWAKLPGS